MFQYLRGLERHNPETYRTFVELTDQLEKIGMFSSLIDLDVHDDGFILSQRRGQWSYMWGYSFVNRKARGLGTMEVFMGQPGSLIKISSLFNLGRPKDDKLELQMVSDITCATAEFIELHDEASKVGNHAEYIQAAQRLAQFFLKQRD